MFCKFVCYVIVFEDNVFNDSMEMISFQLFCNMYYCLFCKVGMCLVSMVSGSDDGVVLVICLSLWILDIDVGCICLLDFIGENEVLLVSMVLLQVCVLQCVYFGLCVWCELMLYLLCYGLMNIICKQVKFGVFWLVKVLELCCMDVVIGKFVVGVDVIVVLDECWGFGIFEVKIDENGQFLILLFVVQICIDVVIC